MKREGLFEGPAKKRAAVVRLNVGGAHFDVAPETLAAEAFFQAGIGADVPSASADDPGDDLVWLQDAVADTDDDAKTSTAAKRSLEQDLADAEAQGIGCILTNGKYFD